MTKHKLLGAGPTEPWSTREKLCLASSVMRSGDQNWVSVSRAIKPFAESGRPPDWFSQKHCASQYSELLETTETPKRKRGEKGEVVETVEDVIVRKLTAERIDELKKLIKDTQEHYRKLKKEAELIQAGHMDSKLEDLWNDIVLKKKIEEEEAEVKRKATDAAYQARQAIRNMPRRLTLTMGRSPAGSTSPGGEYSVLEMSQPVAEEGSSGVSVGSLQGPPLTSFIDAPDANLASAPKEDPMATLADDSSQKMLIGQKVTPPSSPLLSELLKKGSLLPSSPRLLGDGEMSLAGAHMSSSSSLMDVGGALPLLHGADLHLVQNSVPASPAASGAPTLSRLLEAAPAQFSLPLASFSAVGKAPLSLVDSESSTPMTLMSRLPTPGLVTPIAASESAVEAAATVGLQDACLSLDSMVDSDAMAVSVDSSDMSLIMDSIKKDCMGPGVGESKDHIDSLGDSKDELDLSEPMGMADSYTCEELDFETVGDIIAIIEDKADEHPEVLDVAAVEAALSFCEENDDPQSLTGPWDHTLQDPQEKPLALGHVPLAIKQERLEEPDVEEGQKMPTVGEVATDDKAENDDLEEEEEDDEEEEEEDEEEEDDEEEEEEEDEEEEEEEVGDISTSSISEFQNQKDENTVAEESTVAEEDSEKRDDGPRQVKLEPSPEPVCQEPEFPPVREEASEMAAAPKMELMEHVKEEPEPASLMDAVKQEPEPLSENHNKEASPVPQDSQGEEEEEEEEEDEEEEVTSEVGSTEEPAEEETGEGYLSETDNDPPVSESDDGYSIHNAPLQGHTLADSIPSSPASSLLSACSEDQEALQAQKIWKKAIMLVWRAAANHRYANVFLQPVTDDIAPGYHSIVQRFPSLLTWNITNQQCEPMKDPILKIYSNRPMDLSTIKKNIETSLIRTTAEFQRDIMLMFQNAVMYNSSDHDVYHMAVEMQRDVLEQIQQFLATQLIMQTSESGISAKSLRGRDSARKQDASEKDSVPMGSPAFLLSLFDGGTRGRRCAIEADMKMKK